jgi:internalin A
MGGNRGLRVMTVVAMGAILWVAPAVAGVEFPDKNLETVIREILKKKQIDKPEIDEADLKTIYFLEAPKRGIKDLTGVDKCTNLASVTLSDNEIENLGPLSACKNIQLLELGRNKISDIAPLAAIVKLQYIDITGNKVTTVEPLAKLDNLRTLLAAGNQVTSLEPLGKLAKIQSLDFDGNQLANLKGVEGMKWLSNLRIRNNKVEDLSPLGGLTDLKFTFLNGNPVKDLTPLVTMAKNDVEGQQRFAPYWMLFVDIDLLPEAARKQVEELRKLGVRVNPSKS